MIFTKYRRRYREVEAVQWTGNNRDEVTALVGAGYFDTFAEYPCLDDPEATATLLESEHSSWQLVYTNDWIVRDDHGRRFRCRAVEFAAEYEPVAAPTGVEGEAR